MQVPFSEKEDIKDLGGRFDYLCKKWYVDDDNHNINIILSKWEKAVPDQRNTKHPYWSWRVEKAGWSWVWKKPVEVEVEFE